MRLKMLMSLDSNLQRKQKNQSHMGCQDLNHSWGEKGEWEMNYDDIRAEMALKDVTIHSLEAEVKDLKHCLKAQEQIKEGMWEAQCRQSNEIKSLESKAEQAEKRVKFFERATCVTPKGWLYFMGLEEVVKDLTAQLEDMKNMWRNAEDANIKLSEKIVEYRKLLEKDSDLQAKMADGWCLVSPEDFERLQEAKRVGD
jgi:chromosome segregation ATPase